MGSSVMANIRKFNAAQNESTSRSVSMKRKKQRNSKAALKRKSVSAADLSDLTDLGDEKTDSDHSKVVQKKRRRKKSKGSTTSLKQVVESSPPSGPPPSIEKAENT